MSAKQSIPNPEWVSAPYKESGFVQSEHEVAERAKAIGETMGINVEYSTRTDAGGLVLYHIDPAKRPAENNPKL